MCLERRDKHNGLRFSRPAFANRADAFGGFEFDRHLFNRERHCFSEGFANRKPVVFEFWPLANYGRIHVGDVKSGLPCEIAGMPQELKAVAAFPSRIGVGKVHADVARGNGAENRIGDGVG